MNNEVCSLCNKIGGVKHALEDEIHTVKGQSIIIKNVPVFYCNNCGGKYYHGSTISRIDDILAHPESTEKISVSVIYF